QESVDWDRVCDSFFGSRWAATHPFHVMVPAALMQQNTQRRDFRFPASLSLSSGDTLSGKTKAISEKTQKQSGAEAVCSACRVISRWLSSIRGFAGVASVCPSRGIF